MKIHAELDPGLWHGRTRETFFAEPVRPRVFRLKNIPFYAFGISFGDDVIVDDKGIITGVARRGGHSRSRLILEHGVEVGSDRFNDAWRPIAEQRCGYERGSDDFVSVDVEPAADIYAVYALLEKGEAEGVWEFEEGFCGHPLKDE